MTGDCIHNLRSALDHLFYGLAVQDAGTIPPPYAQTLQFPISDTIEAFNAERSRRLKGLSASTQAKVERVQPYNGRDTVLPPLLGMLRDLNNTDKHRLLNVVISMVTNGKFSFIGPRLDPFIPKSGEGVIGVPLETGAEIAYFIAEPPRLDVNYQYEATVVISIGHRPGPSGREYTELVYVLEVLIDEVRRVIEVVGL